MYILQKCEQKHQKGLGLPLTETLEEMTYYYGEEQVVLQA